MNLKYQTNMTRSSSKHIVIKLPFRKTILLKLDKNKKITHEGKLVRIAADFPA